MRGNLSGGTDDPGMPLSPAASAANVIPARQLHIIILILDVWLLVLRIHSQCINVITTNIPKRDLGVLIC